MSLAYSASPWINEESNTQPQKRVSTMKKMLKKVQVPKPEFMPVPNPDIGAGPASTFRSEEHTSELQSH